MTELSEETFSVFILKITKGSMKAAETFLKNRNWQVGSAVNMREALAYIIQKQPQYLLIAADHPNKKVKILPRLIAQAFPIHVIAFSEGTTQTSMNALREMNLPNTLFPPVSGPAIERMVLKIKKAEEDERHRQEATAKRIAEGGGTPGSSIDDPTDGTIRLKGESQTTESMQHSFSQARAALAALASGHDSDDHESSGPIFAQGGDPLNPGEELSAVQKGLSQTEYSAEQGSEAEGHEFGAIQEGLKAQDFAAEQGGPASEEHAAEQEGRRAKEFSLRHPKKPEESEQDYAERMKRASQDPFYPQQNRDDTSPSGAFQEESEESSNWQDLGEDPHARRPAKAAPTMESDPVAKKNKNTLYIRGEKADLVNHDSLVIKGSIEALDSTVVVDDSIQDEEVQKVESASNVACITIESPRFSGYLIAALGKNRKIDQDFIDTIKKRLFAFLRANGEVTVDENPMGIKIKEVEFEGWALEQAEFLRKSVHHGDEIAMAFFPNKDVSTKLEDSASETMAKMTLDEIKDDTPLEFDLYMYMPENKKYLLYTAQGNPIYGSQKGRLKEKGITHMHLRKESIGDVKKYRAQNFLNDKIEAYRQAKKIKGS